jgi:catechol 2,3-dioxygenase-like lactoylglutathione lyase family enzyme
MTAAAALAMVNIDCADPRAQAEFYHQVLGWEVTYSDDNYSMVTDGQSTIGFGKIDGYQPPAWPDPATPKQFHLDFYVDDLDKAERICLDAGAAKPGFQPGADRWRVLTDPAGHPFCICVKQDG